jgi:flagellar M-ring protein FliF
MNVGDVQRLSVAVVVNYKTLPDGKPLPLTADQMKQIEDLTREAMGFSDKRGDTLNVVNPFTATDDSIGELPFWKQQVFIEQLMTAGRWLLVLLVAWILWRKAVRPQLVRRAKKQKRYRTNAYPSGNRRSGRSSPQQRRTNPAASYESTSGCRSDEPAYS